MIAAEGYVATTPDIRRFRQAALAAPEGSPLRALAALRDFHSISEMRDMVFHVQEHRTTLPAIKTLLATLGVRFLGFQMPPVIVADYARRFPKIVIGPTSTAGMRTRRQIRARSPACTSSGYRSRGSTQRKDNEHRLSSHPASLPERTLRMAVAAAISRSATARCRA